MYVSYIWRCALGVLLGFYGTWVVALLATLASLVYRVPQVVKLLRGADLEPIFGFWCASKAASFLIPLWVTVVIMDGGKIVDMIKQYVGLDFISWFIR